jgi:hypothetical protein
MRSLRFRNREVDQSELPDYQDAPRYIRGLARAASQKAARDASYVKDLCSLLGAGKARDRAQEASSRDSGGRNCRIDPRSNDSDGLNATPRDN